MKIRQLHIIFIVTLMALLMFRTFLTDANLMTTDDNIAHFAERAIGLPHSLMGQWGTTPMIGTSGPIGLGWTNVLLWLLPLRFFNNWIHAIDLALSSLFLIGFLRMRGVKHGPSLLAALTALWLASNFTLTFAGHIGKYGVLLFASASLFCIEKSALTKRTGWAVLAGSAMGAMFIEQQDLALFFAMLLGSYLLFCLWREQRAHVLSALIKQALPLFGMALIVASHALLSGYRGAVDGVASLQESKQQQWEFCTQWSWPPEESIDFIAPGYTGWRSGEPAGPYWGRMGRSAGWEQTRQGFMNFKLENTYIGFIPIALALFGLASCRRSRHRAEIIFWSSATAVALILAFGKHFPLYYAFWHLPVVNSIRNPNKFLQVFQVALGIMTAYGADALFSGGGRGDEGRGARDEIEKLPSFSSDSKVIGWFFWGLCGAVVLVGVSALSVSLGTRGIAAGFSRQGWPPDMASVIASNQGKALWHAFFMTVVTTVVFGLFAFPRFAKLLRFRNRIAGALVFIVASDAIWLSRHYIKTMPPSYIAENAVTALLKHELGHQRTAMATQESFYNLWLTYLFPYHQIPAFNITQMPRMPQDYKRFLETVGRNPLRMWQLSAVGYLLAPSGILNQLPASLYQPVLRYDVIGNTDGNFSVQPRDTGAQVVLRCLAPAPRYALIGGCMLMEDDQALARLASNDHPPFEKIILPPDASVKDPGGQGVIGQVEVLDYRPGHVRLKVQSDRPGFLRAADKFDPDWIATINGTATDVLRADFIFQAVYIPAGTHEVEMNYNPPTPFLWVQFAGMALCLCAGISLIARRVMIRG